MSDRISTNAIHAPQNNNDDSIFERDGLRRRRQQPPLEGHQPRIRQIHRGHPPRGFSFARQIHPNNNDSSEINSDSNVDSLGRTPAVHANGNGFLNSSTNGNTNGSTNNDRNRNVQRVRLNLGRRGPFVMRQQQHQGNPIDQDSQQQQQQQQPQQQQRPLQFLPMGPNGPIQMGPNGPMPVQVRMQVQVEPLTPQPLSSSMLTTNTSSQTNAVSAPRNFDSANSRQEDPPDYERYKCEICYEYLNDPVGCGKCASRFCRACLKRVYESDLQKLQPTRCPVCRCEYNEMVADPGIYGGTNRVDKAPTLPCRFANNGCPERNLPLYEIAKHEQTCDHAPVRCRYAPYGCPWVGKRGLVQAHEEFGCKCAPMKSLIEQFRQLKAQHSMRLEMITQQASGSVRMSHVLRQTYTRDNQRKSLSDVLRLTQYCHAVTSLTPHFLMTKDLWVSYWRNNESRAAVVNFCTCAPFLAAAIGVVGRGTNSFFELFEEEPLDRTASLLAKLLEGGNTNIINLPNQTAATEKITNVIQALQQSQTEELLITAFLGGCVGILGLLVIMLSYIDTKSNISWDKIRLPYFGGNFPLVGDVMAISIFTLLLAIMEYHESNIRAVVLWLTVVVTSTFFPALVFSISHYTARLVTRTPRPAAFNMMEMARLVEPCMFGLRFSMVIIYFGAAANLDASVVLSLMPRTSRLYLKNSFFDYMPRSARFAFLATKCAFWAFRIQNVARSGDLDLTILKEAITIESAQKFFTSSPSAVALSSVLDNIFTSIMATASLMITNGVINCSFFFGIRLGDYIALRSQGELSPEGIARGTAKEYSPIGLFVFGSWLMLIVLLTRV